MGQYMQKNLRQAQFANNDAVDNVFCLGAPSVTYSTGSVSASTDPFTSKTNKYAESQVVLVASATAVHVKFGSSAPTATTSDFLIPTSAMPYAISIDSERAFMAVIPTTGSATIFVTEVY